MPRLLLAALLVCAPLARAQEPAALIPDDAFFYVEVDVDALEKGMRELDVAKTLADPKFADFFRPGFRKLELVPDDPVGSLIKKAEIREWLAGHAAVAVRGLTVSFDKRKRNTVTPDKPVGLALVHDMMGALFSALLRDGDRAEIDVRLDLDFCAVIQPGEKLKKWMQDVLTNPPFELKRRAVQVGDRQLLHLAFPAMRLEDNLYYAPELYAHMGEKRWAFATDADVLVQMLNGGPPKPLVESERFLSVRKRMTAGHRAVFAWLDAGRALQIFKRFVPPILSEALEKHGLASVRGAGFGMSFTEGGVRESFGLVLDGKPKGVWRLLDALPGGLRSIEIAPPDTRALLGFKFDLAMLVRRTKEVFDDLAPGTSDALIRDLAGFFASGDIDLQKDVLPALGDEIGLMLFAPKAMVPDWAFGLDVRDEAAFRRLLPRLQGAVGDEWKEVEIAEGVRGWQVAWTVPGPAPWFTVHKGHFFGASNRQLLIDVYDKWGTRDAKTLAKDGETFRRTLRGLNGGQRENLVALAYLDLRSALPLIAGMWPFDWTEVADYVDLDHLPDVARLTKRLAGVAIGVRRDGHGITLDLYSPVGLAWFPPLLIPRTVMRIVR